jgi:acyl-CoA thioesterase I
MWRFLAALLLLLTLAAAAPTRTILVVGDSLSAAYNIDLNAGWVALLGDRLAERKLSYQVVNASISGDTTAGGLARLPRLLNQHRPAIVIIELGGNDGLRGVSPAEAKHNLHAMIAQAKSAGAKVLLLGIRLPPNYGIRYTERFQRLYRELAAETGVPFVPFLLEGVATDTALMQADGIHPNAAAQGRVLDNVWERLQPLLYPGARNQRSKS